MYAPATSTHTDADAIAASTGDPRAFAAIFDRHFTAIHRYLAARLGVDAADELAAEVFERAFDARARYDPAYPDARPWLFGIATNLVHRRRRDERRRLIAYARIDRDGAEPSPVDGAVARVDARASSATLANALRALRRGDRDALLLVAWADMTYEEAARVLDVPVGTVRSRVHRARRLIRAALIEEEQR